MLLTACAITLSDNSDADPSDITVSGTVTNTDFSKTNMNKVAIAFISDDHIALATVTGNAAGSGTYSVTLKADHNYNVRSFNMKNDASNVIKVVSGMDGSNMDYLIYKNIRTGESDYTLDLAFEKATKYTDQSSNNVYYLYESGLATLVKVGIEFDELEGDVPYRVKEGQTIVIPETISVDSKEYKVTFVGNSVCALGLSIIQGPNLQIQKPLIFRGETSNTLTIRFEGDVILNFQPFTAPFGAANAGTQVGEKFNFNVIFDKDVSVNSFPKTTTSRVMASGYTLTAIEEVSIGGVYRGAVTYLNNEIIHDFGAFDLANTNFKAITFDGAFDGLSVDEEYDYYPMKNATIEACGLVEGSTLTATLNQESGKFVLKNRDNELISDSVNNVTNNPEELKSVTDPITFAVVNGDSVTYSLLTKGHAKGTIDEPEAPEGMDFAGWYKNSEYTQEYEPDEQLNANTTVYAKYVPKQYTISIFGDGIVVKNGDNAVGNGSKIEFDTTLTLVVENRIGYNAVVKMDGTVIAGNTVKVPAKDFTISCEWAAIDYVVKCMDGETEVKSIENCHIGDVVSLPAMDKTGFAGWSVDKGMLLGAQYVVNYRDAGENDIITLKASFTELQDTVWELTVIGGDGKAFWTKSNAIGSYGIVTVLPAEFEKASVSIDPAVDGAYVGKLSDNTYMVFSANGEDVTVAVAFQSVEKASEYTVSLVEIAKEGSPGFRATVAATDGGIVDTSGKLSIRYVYKAMDEVSGLWCFTTSGQTTGVDDYVVPLGGANDKAYSVTGDFYLNSIEAADGAYLVYGYASYAFGDSSVTAETTVMTSPVIMSVSEIQAVVSKS